MSQHPPPPPPPSPSGVDYYNPMSVPRRPTSVTVLAIIAIVLGSLTVLCSPLALLPYFGNFSGPPNPPIDAVTSNRSIFYYMVISTVVGWLLGIVELAGGIGSLKLKPWARDALIFFAIATIVIGIIGLIVSVTWIFPKMYPTLKGSPAAIGGYVGGLIGGSLGFVFPVFIIVYYRKPQVVEAFKPSDALR